MTRRDSIGHPEGMADRSGMPRKDAFSLIEMLAVLSVVGLLVSLSVPVARQVLRANHLRMGGHLVVDQLKLARQTAMTKNLPVEIRFYQLPDYNSSSSSPEVFRAFQLFLKAPERSVPLGKAEFLEHPVYFVGNSAPSPLLSRHPALEGSSAGIEIARFGNRYRYVAFTYRSDGSTDLSAAGNFVTLALQHDKPIDQGGNFITVQIDPVVGSVQSFQP